MNPGGLTKSPTQTPIALCLPLFSKHLGNLGGFHVWKLSQTCCFVTFYPSLQKLLSPLPRKSLLIGNRLNPKSDVTGP